MNMITSPAKLTSRDTSGSRIVKLALATAIGLTATVASKDARSQIISNTPIGIAHCRDLEKAMEKFTEYPSDTTRQYIESWRNWTAGYVSAYADQTGKTNLKAMDSKKISGAVMMNCYADPDKPITRATLEALARLAP